MRPHLTKMALACSLLMLMLAVAPWSRATADGVDGEYSLMQRIRRLEAIEEITKLKSRYIVLIDEVIADPAAADEFASLFVHDFVVEYGDYGTFTDKPSLKAFLADVISPAFAWGFHTAHNPRIEVFGNEATAEWDFTADVVATGASTPVRFYGRYVDHYVKTPHGWKFEAVFLNFETPPVQ